MVRTQIQLTDDQSRKLRRLAARRGVSMATLIREGVDSVLAEEGSETARRRALAVIGAFRGGRGEPVSDEHDRYLGKALEDWRRS
jgi:Arc/MetJ-type ribon-helix-helix transcriptional regulator